MVRKYLDGNLERLIKELADYHRLFDPHKYDRTQSKKRTKQVVTIKEARTRIAMFRLPFEGWSLYEVHGFFKGADGRLDEETTQVVRLMFRLKSAFLEKAVRADCRDVLRAMLFWVLSREGRLRGHYRWDRGEKARFLTANQPWLKHKKMFAEKYFGLVAREATKFIDDYWLFVFGYLVRNFWKTVLAKGRREDQIWVTSLSNLSVNIVKRVQMPENTKGDNAWPEV